MSTNIIQHSDFTSWTEHDLMYNLDDRFNNDEYEYEYEDENNENENENKNNSIIHNIIDCIYEEIMIYVDDPLEFTREDIINFIDFYKQTIAIERLTKYEEELIMKTWHPSRLFNWCFTNEDKNDFGIIDNE